LLPPPPPQQQEIQDDEVMFFPDFEEHFVQDQFSANQGLSTHHFRPTSASAGVASSCFLKRETNCFQLQEQQEEKSGIRDESMGAPTTLDSPSSSSQQHDFKANAALTEKENKNKNKKKRKKRSGPNSDGIPIRPLSAYNLFFQARRADLLSHIVVDKSSQIELACTSTAKAASNTTKKLTTTASTGISYVTQKRQRQVVVPQMLGKIIGKQWRELKGVERKVYEDMADRECERYRREMEAVNCTHKNDSNKRKSSNGQSPSWVVNHQCCSKNSTTTTVATVVTPNIRPAYSRKVVPRTGESATLRSTSDDIYAINDIRRTGMLSSSRNVATITAMSRQSPQVVAPSSVSSIYSQHNYVAASAIGTTANGDSQQRYHVCDWSHHLQPPHTAALAPHVARTVLAMPPGMEFSLKNNNSIISSNNNYEASSSLQEDKSRRTSNDHHQRKQQPTLSECSQGSQQQQQRYRLFYQCCSMSRYQADQCIETFLTKGINVSRKPQQKHA
jgi:hypothetical protein